MSLIVGSVGVAVVPDAEGFSERMRAELGDLGDELGRRIADQISQRIGGAAPRIGESAGRSFGDSFKARVDAALKSLPDAEVRLDDLDAEVKLARLRSELRDLSAQRIGVDLTAEEAQAKVDALLVEIKELREQAKTIDVKFDLARAEAQLAAFKAQLKDLNDDGLTETKKKSEEAEQGFSSLLLAGLTIGPSLIPVLSVTTAAVGVLGAAFSATGLGAGAFALLGESALKGIQSGVGPAGVALAGLKSDFAGLQAAVKPEVLGVATTALGDLRDALPLLRPLALSAADGFERLGEDFKGFEPQIASITGAFSRFTSSAIAGLGHALIGLGVSVGNILVGFLPLAERVLPAIDSAVDRLVTRTSDLTASKGFQGFLNYAEANGPKVAAAFEALGGAAAHFVEALAPLGTFALIALKGIGDAIHAIPVPLLTGITIAVVTLGVAVKGVAVAKKISTAFDGLGAAKAGVLGVAGALGVVGGLFATAFEKVQEQNAAVKAFFGTLSSVSVSTIGSAEGVNAAYQAQSAQLQSVIDGTGKLSTVNGQLAITQVGAAQAAGQQKLAQDGLNGGILGSLSGVTQAQQALEKLTGQQITTTTNTQILSREFNLSQDQVYSLAQANGITLTGSLKSAEDGFRSLQTSTVQANSKSQMLSDAQKTLASSFSSANDKATALETTLNLLSGNSVAAGEAQNNLVIAEANLKGSLDASSKTLIGNSAAAAVNQNAVLALVQQAQAAAEAQEKVSGNTVAATAAYNTNLAAIKQHAIAAGLDATQVNNLLAQYNSLPVVKSTKVTTDTSQPTTALDVFKKALAALPAAADSASEMTTGAFRKNLAMLPGETSSAVAPVPGIIQRALAGLGKLGQSLGGDFGDGFVQGIASRVGKAAAAAAAVANSAAAAVKLAQQSGSPSRITMGLGGDFGDGYALGIGGRAPTVRTAAAGLTAAAIGPLSAAPVPLRANATLADVTVPTLRLPAGATAGSDGAAAHTLIAEVRALRADVRAAGIDTGDRVAAGINGATASAAQRFRNLPGRVGA